ncbi:hypothetical protein DERF_006573 [Dermatophagoides farinae]|uniref:Uncharacterized protein n=1 Tax=Dermatophagoides farinae TaxID=6954 RepID=A0A922HWE8_DERFA|nr:hypothetical protein DERF_006573 [Dermatophagoides farinae]
MDHMKVETFLMVKIKSCIRIQKTTTTTTTTKTKTTITLISCTNIFISCTTILKVGGNST